MYRKLFFLLAVLIISVLAFPRAALAHATIPVGDYAVEYGWMDEPPISGQPNAVVINISPKGTTPEENKTDIDISGLKVEAIYGEQTKILILTPLGEDTHGQFIATMTPTRPGTYTIHLSGTIGSTTFNNDVQPEEVQPADVVQFPIPDSTQGNPSSTDSTNWIGIAGLLLGALGTILGVIALVRRPPKG